MIYYAVRRRGAIGVASELLHVQDFDELVLKHPDYEPVAAFQELHEARRYFVSVTMLQLMGRPSL